MNSTGAAAGLIWYCRGIDPVADPGDHEAQVGHPELPIGFAEQGVDLVEHERPAAGRAACPRLRVLPSVNSRMPTCVTTWHH